MKRFITIITIIIGAITFNSCTEDILDKQPLDYISDASIWNEPGLIDGYLAQCYADMKFYNNSAYTMQTGSYIADNKMTTATTMADEAWTWASHTWRHLVNWIDVYSWWGYEVVRKLNIFLEKIETSPLDADIISQKKAEARFLRAFSYFNMVIRYGGVPLITEVQYPNDPDEVLYPFRAKEEEIYQFVIDELQEIVDQELLPKEIASAELGRPSYYAALALISRAGLYAGTLAKYTTEKGLTELLPPSGVVGIPANRAEYFLQISYDASNEIIEEGPFSLYEKYNDGSREGYIKNYRNLFLDEDNNEIIMAEKYNGPEGKGHSRDFWECPMGYMAWSKGQFSPVLPDFVDAYQNMDNSYTRLKDMKGEYTRDEIFGNKDPRFDASIYTEGTPFNDPQLPTVLQYYKKLILPDGSILNEGVYEGFEVVGYSARSGGDRLAETPFGVLKYLDVDNFDSRTGTNRSETDWIIFRLGEIYLNRAEAALELGIGDPAADMLKIRERAGMPADAVTIENIRHERQIELAFEGHRFFDIRRYREGPKYLGVYNYGIAYQLIYESIETGTYRYKIEDIGSLYSETSDRTYEYKYYYHPITLGRTSTNSNLEGNPGWNEDM